MGVLLAIAVAVVLQPAIPLVTHDPYTSVWCVRDRLTDDWPRHWTGAVMGMCGLVRVDGVAYRWCGPMPRGVPAATQTRVEVLANETRYEFEAGEVTLTVRFVGPFADAADLAACSQGITSVGLAARSSDGKAHDVRAYVDLTGEWCVHDTSEMVSWSRHRAGGLGALSMGSVAQPILAHAGDWRRIDWGRLLLASSGAMGVGGHDRVRSEFVRLGQVPAEDDLRMPRSVSDDWPVLATVVDLSTAASGGGRLDRVLIAYDPGRVVELHERPLRAMWRSSDGGDVSKRLAAASRREMPDDGPTGAVLAEAATRVGGEPYARLVALAYRQVLAGHGIAADWDGTPLMFPKEITSNGCVSTVDVIYPAAPFFLYHNPAMLRAQLRPVLDYAQSPRWRFPFAPHDLGTYPKANGQVYGGGERTEESQMPVEESGNMLILMAALARVEGGPAFALPYMPMLERWAEYLREHGLDPTTQLCTDDFAGHLARNANLSIKTCVALGAFAQVLASAGRAEDSAKWRRVAEQFAARWQQLARGPGASVLAFGAPATDRQTWSQKYNLVWDRVLGLGLFPDEVADREMAWYRDRLNRFGLPLDSRQTYTKTDWTCWTACLTGRRGDFDAIMGPVYAWAVASPPPSRVPLTDWYETTDGTTKGMHTRTVVGGLWMPLLMDKLGVGWR